jgi:hypothetical protein
MYSDLKLTRIVVAAKKTSSAFHEWYGHTLRGDRFVDTFCMAELSLCTCTAHWLTAIKFL